MTVVPRLTLLLAISFLAPQALTSGQGTRPALSFGVPIASDMKSGEVHEYGLTPVTAGDLVSGTMEVRGLAALVQVLDRGGAVIRTDYFFEDPRPVPRRIGFVAPVAGAYRVQIKGFDRFSWGGQVNPGPRVGVVGTASGSYTLRLENAPVAVRMRGVDIPVREDYPSLRLQRLTQDLQAGRPDALQSFWKEVAGKGPLLEAIAGNERDVDVTFLWREIYDTRNVLVLWAGRMDDGYMSRLAGTDIWYKTVRLRRGTRLDYLISPNDRAEDQNLTTQPDPLNPRKDPDDPNYPFARSSVLDMPGAPDEQWALRTPVRRGTIEEKTITSTLLKNMRPIPNFLNNQRPIWIYTPPGYMPAAGPYPLVILFDGAAYVGSAPATFDNLINDGRIRPAIVCFDPGNRGNAGGLARAKSYGDALVQELMPMLRASYPISSNPADIVIGGFSAGGRAAAMIALFHPEVFGNVLSQSGSFREGMAGGAEEPNESARAYLEAPRQPIRFYLEVGLYDNVPGADGPLYQFALDETNLGGNRHLRDVLRAKGYGVTYREVGGSHENIHWRAMLADGLMTLLKR